MPPSPKGGEVEGEIGYLRHIGDNTFLLLVRKGSEKESADFQCGAFPRLEMQRHKASHYQRLARDSGEIVRQAIDQACTSTGGKVPPHNGDGEGLSRLISEAERLQRLVEVSLGDLDTMARSVEKARDSYQDPTGEWGQQWLQGGLWGQFLRRLGISVENTRHEWEETRKSLSSSKRFLSLTALQGSR